MPQVDGNEYDSYADGAQTHLNVELWHGEDGWQADVTDVTQQDPCEEHGAYEEDDADEAADDEEQWNGENDVGAVEDGSQAEGIDTDWSYGGD